MLVVRTAEDPADPVGEFVSAQQALGLYHLTFAMDPLGLYSVQPRALLGQKAVRAPQKVVIAVTAVTRYRTDRQPWRP
jgi:hypothetical protein